MLQCTCNTLLPVAWLLHWYNKHMHKPLRGVNLGGWLVLERWMTPSVFAGTDASNEHQLMMQPDGPERIAKHRQEFMTEADFAWLHTHGIEALRVPVGYWVLESQDGYLEATKQLDWCFAMAQKYHMRVLLDLHAAPGAQNLGDHSGSGNGVVPGQKPPRNPPYSQAACRAL